MNEELREHYRVVLTAIAPEPQVNKGDPRGMQSKVAARLGIGRCNKPFVESVMKRKEIHEAIAKKDQPIKIGDKVLCKHGEGVVTQWTGDGPCGVQIEIGDVVHLSHQFPKPGRGKKGGKIRKLPVSFAPPPRKKRSDAIPSALHNKVRL